MNKYLNKINAISLLIIAGLVTFYYFNNNSILLEAELNNLKENSIPGTNEISNPIFKNKGLNTNPYVIMAKKGIQIKNDIELHEVFAKFTNDNNELIYIEASKGFYSQNNETIKLSGNVSVYDDKGNQTSTKNAIIDIENKKIKLFNNVISISGKSIIKSNSSVVDEKNSKITYTGDVKVKIENKWKKFI